jgi:hypothetical protein
MKCIAICVTLRPGNYVLISCRALEIARGSANGVEIDGVQMPVEKVTHVTFSQTVFLIFSDLLATGSKTEDILV